MEPRLMRSEHFAPDLPRRSFLSLGCAGMLGMVRRGVAFRTERAGPFFKTRGLVITPEDLTLGDWPERAERAGLTTIALHPFPALVENFVSTAEGRKFVEDCQRLGLQVEYELHAMRELLPRSLFPKRKDLFRMNEAGERVADANLCVHSPGALDVTAENARRLAQTLRPTTGRYFFWGDDGQPWCRCGRCRDLSDSDQALVLENHLVKALKEINPAPTLAHLAYATTLAPPRTVRPEPGVFLEYAPIHRRYDVPYHRQTDPHHPDALSYLDANLKVFPAETAQVLEYWLDVSKFSGWKRPAARLPWRKDVLEADLATYASRGVRHVTSFAVYVDADYRQRYGEPTFINEYGKALAEYQP